jgi:hypothetical protein
MKYLFSFLLTLLVGYGQGQTLPICKTVGSGSSAILDCTPNYQLECLTDTPDQLRTKCVLAKEEPIKGIWQFPNVEFEHCTDTVYFHGKSKAIKDIFPEECVVSIKVPPCIAEDGCPVTSGVPFHAITLESPDVPAIKHEVAETSTDWSCVDYTNGGIVARQKNGSFTQYFMAPPTFVTTLPVCTEATRTSPFDSPRKTTYTCADKSRILLTAEDGKRWCHKPESSPKP